MCSPQCFPNSQCEPHLFVAPCVSPSTSPPRVRFSGTTHPYLPLCLLIFLLLLIQSPYDLFLTCKPAEVFNIVQSHLEESAPTTYIQLKDIISRALGKTKAAYTEQLDLMQVDSL
ncbi:hypothetical protein Pcinc_026202 [Petrolisthes cinctipes]|uniref:Uncharacterized protein n=1 Tax=Petrolisthes cinctipes TaxID=88211 RepID=A0AAE1F8Z0_PETCI|nr:hypothetical protein Pcinc_026202 [Petrolisthes cinctipes]